MTVSEQKSSWVSDHLALNTHTATRPGRRNPRPEFPKPPSLCPPEFHLLFPVLSETRWEGCCEAVASLPTSLDKECIGSAFKHADCIVVWSTFGRFLFQNFILPSRTERRHWLPQYKTSAVEIRLSMSLLKQTFLNKESPF